MNQLTDQADILLLNRIIPIFPIDSHFSENDIANAVNATPNHCHKIILFLRNNNFIKTGIFSLLQREENEPGALLTLTNKGFELVKCGRYENFLKKEVDEKESIAVEKLKNNLILIFSILSFIVAIIALLKQLNWI